VRQPAPFALNTGHPSGEGGVKRKAVRAYHKEENLCSLRASSFRLADKHVNGSYFERGAKEFLVPFGA